MKKRVFLFFFFAAFTFLFAFGLSCPGAKAQSVFSETATDCTEISLCRVTVAQSVPYTGKRITPPYNMIKISIVTNIKRVNIMLFHKFI